MILQEQGRCASQGRRQPEWGASEGSVRNTDSEFRLHVLEAWP